MGTNYYAQSKPCPTCGHRQLRLHIGKMTSGFRGYLGNHDTPWGPIRSWADWKRVLVDHEHEIDIVDEYDEQWSLDEFIATVEDVPVERRRQQYDLVRTDHPGHAHQYWVDAEQWTFCDQEFS